MKRWCSLFLLAVNLLFAPVALAGELDFMPMSEAAWKQVNAARAIRTGSPAEHPSIQVIIDVNCPYCAKLYTRLAHGHPDLPVRWVPISYFKPDSELIAAAILAAPDPGSALDYNFLQYDAQARHGAYPADPTGLRRTLPVANEELQESWLKWGGFTPMIVFRARDGRVLMAAGASKSVIARVIRAAAE